MKMNDIDKSVIYKSLDPGCVVIYEYTDTSDHGIDKFIKELNRLFINGSLKTVGQNKTDKVRHCFIYRISVAGSPKPADLNLH